MVFSFYYILSNKPLDNGQLWNTTVQQSLKAFFFTLDADSGPDFLDSTLLRIPNKKNLDEQKTDTLYSLWTAS